MRYAMLIGGILASVGVITGIGYAKRSGTESAIQQFYACANISLNAAKTNGIIENGSSNLEFDFGHSHVSAAERQLTDADRLNGLTFVADLMVEIPYRLNEQDAGAEWKQGALDFIAENEGGVLSINPKAGSATELRGGLGEWFCQSGNGKSVEARYEEFTAENQAEIQLAREDAQKDIERKAIGDNATAEQRSAYLDRAAEQYKMDVESLKRSGTMAMVPRNTGFLGTDESGRDENFMVEAGTQALIMPSAARGLCKVLVTADGKEIVTELSAQTYFGRSACK